MEVAVNFNFDSASTTPYTTAPSSPRMPGLTPYQQLPRYYTSAPTSPSRAAAFYRHFRAATAATMAVSSSSTPSSPSAVIPFDWEETPGTPKSPRHEEKQQLIGDDEDDYSVDDFAFEFSGQLVHDGASAYTATADELFEAGKIRPLKPPPRLYIAAGEYGSGFSSPGGGAATAPSMSPRSPKSPKSPSSAARNFFLASPRRRRAARTQSGGDFVVDPFEVALQEATRGRNGNLQVEAGARARPSRRPSRSLSPLRGLFDFGRGSSSGGDHNTKPSETPAGTTPPASTATNTGGLAKSGSGSKKWRLRDFFLFRSASEGRAKGDQSKDPLRKYTAATSAAVLADTQPDSARGSSFRSTASKGGGEGSVGGSSRRGAGSADGSVGGSSRRSAAGGAVVPSPHEAHYAANRAVSEELRRKTFLPYRQGLLGCLGFSAVGGGASLARGLSSVGAAVSSRRY